MESQLLPTDTSSVNIKPTTSINIDNCVDTNEIYVKLADGGDDDQQTLNINCAAITTATTTDTSNNDKNNVKENIDDDINSSSNNDRGNNDGDYDDNNDNDNVKNDNVKEAMSDAKNEVIASNGVVTILENQSNSINKNNSSNNYNNHNNGNDVNLNNKIIKKNLILLYNHSIDVQERQASSSHQRMLTNDESGLLSPGETSVSPKILSPCRSSCDSTSNVVGTLEDFDEISRLFETRSPLIEKWLREKASADTVARIHSITESTRQSPRSPKRASVTSDLFQQWLQNSPIKVSCVLFTYYLFFIVIFK